MKRLLYVSLFALLVPLSGCFSYTTLHTATPVEKGTGQVNISAGFFGIGDGASGGVATVPAPEFAGRYGVADDMDLGIKLFFLGTAFDFNWAVVNNENLAFALNPSVSVSSFSLGVEGGDRASLTYGTALMNLLLDVKPSEMVTLTIGAKPGWLYAVGSAGGESNAATGFVAGGMAGLQVKLSDIFALMPSFDIIVPVTDDTAGYFFSGGVGFQFFF